MIYVRLFVCVLCSLVVCVSACDAFVLLLLSFDVVFYMYVFVCFFWGGVFLKLLRSLCFLILLLCLIGVV